MYLSQSGMSLIDMHAHVQLGSPCQRCIDLARGPLHGAEFVIDLIEAMLMTTYIIVDIISQLYIIIHTV